MRGAIQPISSPGLPGVLSLGLLLLQPLLAGRYLPGLSAVMSRHIHRWIGLTLVLAIVVHVAGLWLTSPPDVVDALLFVSPTPFSAWGVIAMWTAFGAALLGCLPPDACACAFAFGG